MARRPSDTTDATDDWLERHPYIDYNQNDDVNVVSFRLPLDQSQSTPKTAPKPAPVKPSVQIQHEQLVSPFLHRILRIPFVCMLFCAD